MAEFIAISNESAYRNRKMKLDDFSEVQLLTRFRFNRIGIEHIANLLRADLEPTGFKGLNVETQVLLFLGYAASPNFQRDVGDRLGFAQSTVCKMVHRVSDALCQHANELIQWPITEQSMHEQKVAHYARAEFPGVIGVIDGTEIRVQRPGTALQQTYFSGHKKTHTIKALAVATAEGLFSYVDVTKPGSWNDAGALRASTLFHHFQTGHLQGRILADKGFGCFPWCLTPIRNPTTNAERRYNAAHLRTRNPIERVFGQLKRRFYMIACKLRFKVKNVPRFVLACFALHNLAKRLNVPAPPQRPDDDEEEEEEESSGDEDDSSSEEDNEYGEGQTVARAFAERHFADE